MLSKARVKFIKSLQLKKYRKQEQCFTVEGAKSVQELLISDFKVTDVIATQKFVDEVGDLLQRFKGEVIVVDERQLEEVSEYRTNQSALAIAKMHENKSFSVQDGEYALVLDDIQDPGNLGTLIRTADWYGINKVIASEQTADFYNSKVIQSTMGSFTRVKVFYASLPDYLSKVNLPVYGAFLDGQNVHEIRFASGGFIVIGNEGNGISHDVSRFITQKITIPRYGKAESLNAGMAAGIICDNLRRNAG